MARNTSNTAAGRTWWDPAVSVPAPQQSTSTSAENAPDARSGASTPDGAAARLRDGARVDERGIRWYAPPPGVLPEPVKKTRRRGGTRQRKNNDNDALRPASNASNNGGDRVSRSEGARRHHHTRDESTPRAEPTSGPARMRTRSHGGTDSFRPAQGDVSRPPPGRRDTHRPAADDESIPDAGEPQVDLSGLLAGGDPTLAARDVSMPPADVSIPAGNNEPRPAPSNGDMPVPSDAHTSAAAEPIPAATGEPGPAFENYTPSRPVTKAYSPSRPADSDDISAPASPARDEPRLAPPAVSRIVVEDTYRPASSGESSPAASDYGPDYRPAPREVYRPPAYHSDRWQDNWRFEGEREHRRSYNYDSRPPPRAYDTYDSRGADMRGGSSRHSPNYDRTSRQGPNWRVAPSSSSSKPLLRQPLLLRASTPPSSRRGSSQEPEFTIPLPRDDYIALSREPLPSPAPTIPVPKLLVLDLNGALIYRTAHSGGTRKAYPRPFLCNFLEYLFLPEPNRAQRPWEALVWSSAQPHNVRNMVESAFGPFSAGIWSKERGKQNRIDRGEGRLLNVWARDQMNLGEDYSRKVQTTKDLRKVINKLGMYDERTVVLLDDSPLKAVYQPWSHINITEYDQKEFQAARTAAEGHHEREERETNDSNNAEGSAPVPETDPSTIPGMDPTLLAVIGILEEMRPVANVPAWARSGGLENRLDNPHDTSTEVTLDTLPSHDSFTHWFADPALLAHWITRGKEGLRRKGIKLRHGLTTTGTGELIPLDGEYGAPGAPPPAPAPPAPPRVRTPLILQSRSVSTSARNSAAPEPRRGMASTQSTPGPRSAYPEQPSSPGTPTRAYRHLQAVADGPLVDDQQRATLIAALEVLKLVDNGADDNRTNGAPSNVPQKRRRSDVFTGGGTVTVTLGTLRDDIKWLQQITPLMVDEARAHVRSGKTGRKGRSKLPTLIRRLSYLGDGDDWDVDTIIADIESQVDSLEDLYGISAKALAKRQRRAAAAGTRVRTKRTPA